MKLFFYPILIAVLWITFLNYVFISSLPIPNNTSYKQKATFFNIIPQGWGFFTRDPRENEIYLYTIINNSVVKFTDTNGSQKNFYGASRKNRLIGIELGLLIPKINKSSWKEMKGGKLVFNPKIHTDTILNKFSPCNIKGTYFIVEQERIPWAWSRNYNNLIMPYKYAKIYVKTN